MDIHINQLYQQHFREELQVVIMIIMEDLVVVDLELVHILELVELVDILEVGEVMHIILQHIMEQVEEEDHIILDLIK